MFLHNIKNTQKKNIKGDRYDRQLRLWNDHGQKAIETAKVCLIRGGAVGSEILKNLVLPGVGSFTVIDNSSVQDEDICSSFFVHPDYLQRSRAQTVMENLCDLNDGVVGSYVDDDVIDLIDKHPEFFLGFNVIVVTDARESVWLRLSRLLHDSNIPLVIVFTLGVIGYLRVFLGEHVIIESHPDNSLPDLRLERPPPAVVAMADEMNLEEMSYRDLSQAPWLLILHKFIQAFKEAHGYFPKSYEDKSELKKAISDAGKQLLRMLRGKDPRLDSTFELESFQEACKVVNVAVCPTDIPQEVQEILRDDRCSTTGNLASSRAGEEATAADAPEGHRSPSPAVSDPTFWRLAAALRDFIDNEGEGQLPVRGTLPDMPSDTARYLDVLKFYQDQSEWAVDRLAARLTQFPEITRDVIRLFVRNSAFIRVIRTPSLEQELGLSLVRSEDPAAPTTLGSGDDQDDPELWYLALRSACIFLEETGRWPGCPRAYASPIPTTETKRQRLGTGEEEHCPDQQTPPPPGSNPSLVIESDLPALREHCSRLLHTLGITSVSDVGNKHLEELLRFGGGELHAVSSFMAGVAAQEVIKLITHQFTPVTKPLIYNAITQRTRLLDL